MIEPAAVLPDSPPGLAEGPSPARAVPSSAALPLPPDPLQVLEQWPAEVPLAALLSADAHPRSRWSLLGAPVGVFALERDALGLRARWRWFDESRGDQPPPVRLSDDPLADLLGALDRPPAATAANPVDSFSGGWIARLGYELGEVLQPRAVADLRETEAVARTIAELFWCPWGLVFDHGAQHWHAVGDRDAADRFASRHFAQDLDRNLGAAARSASPFTLSPFRSAWGESRYASAVSSVIDGIARGEFYQVNLAHRLSARFQGSPRGLFARAARAMRPWYGAYMECPPAPGEVKSPAMTPGVKPQPIGTAVLSLSPELFAQFDPTTREVITRPIKGTRPAAPGAEQDLRNSEKDRAELTMIVDLMRNDLGRVCDAGSVRADPQSTIEHHASGVVHAVGTVRGRLREGARLSDFVRAGFPPGSITGAPKIAAMQAIARLEPAARGAYCGAIGLVSACGKWSWNVAIRTIELDCEPGSTCERAHGTAQYGVGAGIVADSDPMREWQETLDKARAVMNLCTPDAEGCRP